MWPICCIQLCCGCLHSSFETAVYSLVCGISDERYGCSCIYKGLVAFACTIVEGKSVKSVTVTWSLEGSPPCSWESLLEEGSTSLKNLIPLLSHVSDHLSCSNQCAGLLSAPSCSSWGVAFLSCWIMNLICMIHTLKISRMIMSVAYCDLSIDNLKSCDVWIICDVTGVVCHVKVCGCVLCGLSEIVMSCFCGGCVYPCIVI